MNCLYVGDWGKIDSILAPTFTYTGDSSIYSKDQYIGFMQAMRDAMTEMTMEFTHVLCEGDLVSIRFITKARNTGKFMGAPATKKNVIVTGSFIRRIVDGKVAQEWQSTELLGLLTQMGFSTLLGYTIGVGLFKQQPTIPKPKLP